MTSQRPKAGYFWSQGPRREYKDAVVRIKKFNKVHITVLESH